MSKVCSACWWTPPIPPVEKTSMLLFLAMRIVEETVVAPSQPRLVARPNSLEETFFIFLELDTFSSSELSNPTQIFPSRIAIVAGTTPRSSHADSASCANSRFFGYGIPCAIIVDSRANRGRDDFFASRTLFESFSLIAIFSILLN